VTGRPREGCRRCIYTQDQLQTRTTTTPHHARGQNGPSRDLGRGLQQTTPPPLVLSHWDWPRRFPRCVPRFRSHQLLPERPLALVASRLPPSPLCGVPSRLRLMWRPLLHIQEEPVPCDGRTWKSRHAWPVYLPRRPGQRVEKARTRGTSTRLRVLVSQVPIVSKHDDRVPVYISPPRFSPRGTHDMRHVHPGRDGVKGPVDGTFVMTPRLRTAGPDSSAQRTRCRRCRLEEQQTWSNDGGPRGMKWFWYDATRGLGLPVFTRAVARRAWRG
jgi:hypothetical protein